MDAIEALKYGACALTMVLGAAAFSFWVLLVY